MCAEIRIDETPTNIVTFSGDPRAVLPSLSLTRPWWTRPDMSINDLEAIAGSDAPPRALAGAAR